MALKLGDTAPDFEADTTEGRIRFHDWIGDSWAVLLIGRGPLMEIPRFPARPGGGRSIG